MLENKNLKTGKGNHNSYGNGDVVNGQTVLQNALSFAKT